MPTETIGGNTADTYSGVFDNEMREGDAFANQDTVANIETSKYSAADYRNILLRFTGVSNIPSGATVTAATLYLYLNNASGAGDTISVYRVLRNWSQTLSTWTNYTTGSTWTSGGARSVTNDVAAASVSQVVGTSTGAYVAFTGLASDVQGWVDGSLSNYGWMLDRTDSADDFHYRVWTATDGADGNRPYLEVTYTVGGGARRWILRA